jgi:lycopene beta-cyclase
VSRAAVGRGDDASADVVIVGGGLAGLSLACHLLRRGFTGKLLVLESRKDYAHDRLWCSWAAPDHPFRDCVVATWSQWRVGLADGRSVRVSSEQPYRCIASGRLYAEALRQIDASANADIRMDARVVAVEDRHDHAEVALDGGARVRAGIVFDGRAPTAARRPATAAGREVDWVQDFLGWRVRAERPVFDPATVTLMQFAARRDDVRFVYVLPFSASEALVEATAFAPASVPDAEHVAALQAHMREAYPGCGYEVVDEERGRVPMSTRQAAVASPGRRIVPIGTAAGMVKASTGYSFEAVQRWSATVADDLVVGRGFVRRAARSTRATCMDRLFLAFMRRRPDRMPELFLRLFERVPADALVRFLSDRAGIRDLAAVVMAMPALSMLVEATRSLRLWARPA